LKKSNRAILTVSDVLPLPLIDDGKHLSEFKQAMRFDVVHHVVAPFLTIL
jgi:hypothetical protein